MASIYRGVRGSELVYWTDSEPVPNGITSFVIIQQEIEKSSPPKLNLVPDISIQSSDCKKIFLAGYACVSYSSDCGQEIGGNLFIPKENGSKFIGLRSIVSVLEPTTRIYIRMFNASTNEFVQLDEKNEIEIYSSSKTPIVLESKNLLDSKGFCQDEPAVYTIHVSSNGQNPVCLHYLSELISY